jgi:hypothetical protein
MRVTVLRTLVLALLAMILAVAAFAITATNSVPSSSLGEQNQATSLYDVQPAACRANGINPTTLIIAGPNATTNGTAGRDLILSSGGGKATLNGGGGGDCLVAASATDTLKGGADKGAVDVCVKNGNAGAKTQSCAIIAP